MKNILKSLFLGKVMYGPFAGMNYLGATKTCTPLPKVLGSYELELQPWLASITPRLKKRLVVVGAAEGYYAVGLLRNHPELLAMAFELDDYTRGLLNRMAEINGVGERLDIRGGCTLETLKDSLSEGAPDLLLMDIEGGENEMLDPVKVPELRDCTILVEVHDHLVPGTNRKLTQLFEGSHTIRRMESVERQPQDIRHPLFRLLARIPGYCARSILSERSARTNWLLMTPLLSSGK